MCSVSWFPLSSQPLQCTVPSRRSGREDGRDENRLHTMPVGENRVAPKVGFDLFKGHCAPQFYTNITRATRHQPVSETNLCVLVIALFRNRQCEKKKKKLIPERS